MPMTTTLTFDSQSTGRACGVVASIVDDNIAENDEVFTVLLQASNAPGVLIGRSSASVTIISDDGKDCLFQTHETLLRLATLMKNRTTLSIIRM